MENIIKEKIKSALSDNKTQNYVNIFFGSNQIQFK